MPALDVRLVAAGSCDDHCLTQAAVLVYSSLPAFYDVFASFGAPVHAVIARSFHVRGTSLQDATLALDARDTVVGVVAHLDLSELTRASYADLQLLLRASDGEPDQLRDALHSYSQKVPLIPGTGRYLARFAVSPSMRGSGLSHLLLDRFEDEGASAFYLHVHRDNKRAISFYRRRGYALTGPVAEFRVMCKSAFPAHHR